MEYIVIGTEVKVNVHIEPVGGLTMDDYNFYCEFYVYPNRAHIVNKEKMVRTDSDNYVAVIHTRCLGCGRIRNRITAYLPDVDCADGVRTELVTCDTDMIIIR